MGVLTFFLIWFLGGSLVGLVIGPCFATGDGR